MPFLVCFIPYCSHQPIDGLIVSLRESIFNLLLISFITNNYYLVILNTLSCHSYLGSRLELVNKFKSWKLVSVDSFLLTLGPVWSKDFLTACRSLIFLAFSEGCKRHVSLSRNASCLIRHGARVSPIAMKLNVQVYLSLLFQYFTLTRPGTKPFINDNPSNNQ